MWSSIHDTCQSNHVIYYINLHIVLYVNFICIKLEEKQNVLYLKTEQKIPLNIHHQASTQLHFKRSFIHHIFIKIIPHSRLCFRHLQL